MRDILSNSIEIQDNCLLSLFVSAIDIEPILSLSSSVGVSCRLNKKAYERVYTEFLWATLD